MKQDEAQFEEMNKRYRQACEEKFQEEEYQMKVHQDVMKIIKQNRKFKKNNNSIGGGSPDKLPGPGSPGKLKSILQDLGKVKSPMHTIDDDPAQQERINKIFSVREKQAKDKTDKLKKDIEANKLKILKIQKDQE